MDQRVEPYARRCAEEGRSLLTEVEAKELLGAFDVPVTDEILASSPQEAVDAAERLSYPVVLKGVSPDIPHKTEADVVRLDLDAPDAVRDGFETISANVESYGPDARLHGVLVQPLVSGQEMILGMHDDDQFGAVMALGTGGVFVETFDDVALRLPPIDEAEAEDMLSGLRGKELLAGLRGREPKDVDALLEVAVTFSEFCSLVAPYVDEVDVNPLMVRPEGEGAVAVDALIRLSKAALATAT